MRPVSLAAIPALLAAPAFAHQGAHLHPHSVEGWVVGLALLAIAGAGVLALRSRR